MKTPEFEGLRPLSLELVREKIAIVERAGTVRKMIETGPPEWRRGKWHTPKESIVCVLVAPGKGVRKTRLLGTLAAIRVRLRDGSQAWGGVVEIDGAKHLRFRWLRPNGTRGGLDLKMLEID